METFKEQNEQINRLSINRDEAIRNALECHRITTLCLQHCLTMSGIHSEQRHITVLKECADLCQITADFMIENSDFSDEICNLCARLCELCAESCFVVDPNDLIMEACISSCRECAASIKGITYN